MKQFMMCGALAVCVLFVLFCGKVCCDEDLQVSTSQPQSENTEPTTTECCQGPATKKPSEEWHDGAYWNADRMMLCRSQDPMDFHKCLARPLSTPDPIPSASSVKVENGQPLSRCRRSPPSNCNFSDPDELDDSWKVVAGYSRSDTTTAFCPGFKLESHPGTSDFTITWTDLTLHHEDVPRDELTLTDTGNMLDSNGTVRLTLLALTRHFMLIRVSPNIHRTMVLQRASDGPQISRLLQYLGSIHRFMLAHNGPAWYICTIHTDADTKDENPDTESPEVETTETESPTDYVTTDNDRTVSPDI